MRTIDKYYNQNDEYVHPFWLGILILLSVMTIIGTLCCLRIRFGEQLRHLCNKLFRRDTQSNDNNSNDDRHSTNSYSYNWPSSYNSTRSQSPKLYTLVNNIRRAKLQKQLAVRQQSSHEDENENENEVKPTVELDTLPQISISPSSDIAWNSDIARKFYASMRNTSQCQNSSSVDSYNNDASLTSNTPSLSIDEPKKPKGQGYMKIFRTPLFFQTIPNQDKLVIAL